MSHFTCAVITDENTNYEWLLERYNENTDMLSPEYLEFEDRTEYIEEEFETETACVELPDGRLIPTYDEASNPYFVTEDGIVRKDKVIEGCKIVKAPISEFFDSIDDFARERLGYVYNVEQECWGYWYNPNAKWDWYSMGGRWQNMLKFKDGTKGDEGLIDEIDFKQIVEDRNKEAKEMYEAYTEVNPEDPSYSAGLRELFIKQYPTFEDFKKKHYKTTFSTYAVITPDGEWHEPGKVGWWGTSSATAEEEAEWHDKFYKNFIEPYFGQNMSITIVDCHI